MGFVSISKRHSFLTISHPHENALWNNRQTVRAKRTLFLPCDVLLCVSYFSSIFVVVNSKQATTSVTDNRNVKKHGEISGNNQGICQDTWNINKKLLVVVSVRFQLNLKFYKDNYSIELFVDAFG